MRIYSSMRRGVAAVAGLAVLVASVQGNTFIITAATPSYSSGCFYQLTSPPTWKTAGVYNYPTTYIVSANKAQVEFDSRSTAMLNASRPSGNASYWLTVVYDVEWVPDNPGDTPVIGADYTVTLEVSQRTNMQISMGALPVIPGDPTVLAYEEVDTVTLPIVYRLEATRGNPGVSAFYDWGSSVATSYPYIEFNLVNGHYVGQIVVPSPFMELFELTSAAQINRWPAMCNIYCDRRIKIVAINNVPIP